MRAKLHTLCLTSAIALACLAASAGTTPSRAETLDFRQSVAIALAQNPELAASQARIEQSRAAQAQAQGAGLPRVNLSLTATRSNDPLNAFGLKLGQAGIDPAVDFSADNLNSPDAVNNLNARIEVVAPVYTGGQLTAQAQQAGALVRAAYAGDEATRQMIIRQVADAYQGVHSARAHIRVAEQSAATAGEYLRVAENLYRQGMAVKSDMLSARVHLEDARLRVAEARRREAGALDRLKLLLGRPLSESLDVAGPNQTGMIEASEPELLERARAEHPGIRALREKRDAAMAQVEMARAGHRPQVNLMARHDWNDEGVGLSAPSYTVAGVLSWSAFDGGATKAGIARAQAGHAELAAILRQYEDSVLLEIREARRLAIEAATRLAAREAAVLDAEEAQRLTKKRYENGISTLADLLAVQTQLDRARADRVAAGHDLEISRIELKRAAGMLSVDTL